MVHTYSKTYVWVLWVYQPYCFPSLVSIRIIHKQVVEQNTVQCKLLTYYNNIQTSLGMPTDKCICLFYVVSFAKYFVVERLLKNTHIPINELNYSNVYSLLPQIA